MKKTYLLEFIVVVGFFEDIKIREIIPEIKETAYVLRINSHKPFTLRQYSYRIFEHNKKIPGLII